MNKPVASAYIGAFDIGYFTDSVLIERKPYRPIAIKLYFTVGSFPFIEEFLEPVNSKDVLKHLKWNLVPNTLFLDGFLFRIRAHLVFYEVVKKAHLPNHLEFAAETKLIPTWAQKEGFENLLHYSRRGIADRREIKIWAAQ